jgi:hypothetical protein
MEDVRIVPSDHVYEIPVQRSGAQKLQDELLDTAEELATEAQTALAEALDYFAVLKTSQHRTLPTLVGQFVEEIRELRRMRQ